MIDIQLTEEDAQLFLKFREHQSTFAILEEAGVFNVRNGKAVLNFDANGTLCDIECTLKTFKRGIDIVPVLITLHTKQ